jgi:hypothetical protein
MIWALVMSAGAAVNGWLTTSDNRGKYLHRFETKLKGNIMRGDDYKEFNHGYNVI